jgi:hypothetical protein
VRSTGAQGRLSGQVLSHADCDGTQIEASYCIGYGNAVGTLCDTTEGSSDYAVDA